ncbi:MAG: MurR/RpiR family transcriptional regulator [Clostridium sp.]|nr:MurR/RpiR family transcriptional regulator [Clostridium sp.]
MRLEELVEENYDKLNENDFYIWRYIVYHREQCKDMSIQQLAEKCNVSHTTILRFVHKLGLDGYSEMKVYLKWESKNKRKIKEEDIKKSCKCIENTMDKIRNKDFKYAFELLDDADKIYVYGTGEVQKNVAKELKRLMLFCNKLIYNLEGSTESEIILDSLSENDVFIILSLSGENIGAIKFAKKLKERGIKIITITKDGNNELSNLSDFPIKFYAHDMDFSEGIDKYWTTTQFFLISELIMLKYLMYKN